MRLKELIELSEEVFPPCNVADLKALEQQLKLKLPRSYRSLLLAGNGMRFLPRLTFPQPWRFDPSDADAIVVFFGVADARQSRSISNERKSYDFSERVPPNIIPIGETLGQQLLCLSCAGEDTGSVYLWRPGLSWEEDEEDNVKTYQYLRPVGTSFEEFLESLSVEEED